MKSRRGWMWSAVLVLTWFLQAQPGTACNEHFESNSSPSTGALGQWPDGSNYGQGQSFTLDCDSQLESIAYHLSWGNDVGEIRSFAYGDTIHVSVLTLDGTELMRRGMVIDSNAGNRVVTHLLAADNILLPAGTYVAAIWTDVAACGGIGYYNSDILPDSRYLSTTATNPTSWSAASGELAHTILVNTDITPAGGTAWGAVKAIYR